MNKLFTIAGTSVLNGAVTFRFATGKVSTREYVLKRNGHTDVSLFELPHAMTREDAVAYLTSAGYQAVMPGKSKAHKSAAVVLNCDAEIEAMHAALALIPDMDPATAKRDAKREKDRARKAAARALAKVNAAA